MRQHTVFPIVSFQSHTQILSYSQWENQEKACYHYYVTDRKRWTQLVWMLTRLHNDGNMPMQYLASKASNWNSKSLPRCFAKSWGLVKYKVANVRCVDISGRCYASTPTEESSCLRASASQVSALGPLSSRRLRVRARMALVLVKSVVFGEAFRQTLLFGHWLYWMKLRGHICHNYKTESTLCTNQVHHFWPVMYVVMVLPTLLR